MTDMATKKPKYEYAQPSSTLTLFIGRKRNKDGVYEGGEATPFSFGEPCVGWDEDHLKKYARSIRTIAEKAAK